MLHAAELSRALSERKIVCNAGILRASPQAVIPHAFSVLCPPCHREDGEDCAAVCRREDGEGWEDWGGGEDCGAVLRRGTKKAGQEISRPAAILKTHALCDAAFTCG